MINRSLPSDRRTPLVCVALGDAGYAALGRRDVEGRVSEDSGAHPARGPTCLIVDFQPMIKD